MVCHYPVIFKPVLKTHNKPIQPDKMHATRDFLPLMRALCDSSSSRKRYFMKSKFFLPPGPIARRFEGVVVCISGLLCFGAYALINFDICEKTNCNGLEITKLFASISEAYIAYGISIILTGVYLYSNKELNRIFRLGIELTALIGVFLSCMIVFGMLREIANVT